MSNFQGIRAALRPMATVALSLLVAFGASAQTVRYIHTDGLGSVVLVTDKDRNVVERREYEPYGSVSNQPLTDGPGYTGHVMDAATGLTYMQERYYDTAIGRFLSVDPITANSGAGTNFNRYKYAGNNPYKFTDPDGRQEMPIEERDEFREEFAPTLVPISPEQMAEPTPSLVPDPMQEIRDGAAEAGRELNEELKGNWRGSSNEGRSGRQERLREIPNDPKASRSDRGWIRNEQRQIQQGNRSKIRTPPGKQLAHERGREAAKGYSYKYSNLQDRSLHRTQHRFDDFGRANKERPVKDDEN